jgi:transposase
MKILDVVGIDVSKLTIDVVIHSNQQHYQFENTRVGFRKLTKWALKESLCSKENLLYVFEHTGLYSYELSIYLTEKEIPFSMVPGLEIKRSLGISRGKDDKKDARVIARYAYRLRDEIQLTVIATKEIQKLKNLLRLRERMVKQRSGYKASLREMKRVLTIKDNPLLISSQQKIIDSLAKQILKIEECMYEIIDADETLKEQFNLITSIKGIGSQTALNMIVITDGFTKFKTSRHFASYSGIAPFPNSSGTSIRGRTKVNNLANKRIIPITY